MVIKPSGVSYDELGADAWSSATSTATWSRASSRPAPTPPPTPTSTGHLPDVGGVVHTHSTYATAWAARGEAIPCVLTMAGRRVRRRDPRRALRPDRRRLHRRGASSTRCAPAGPPPCSCRTTARSPSARIARAAVKAAVMVEDVARTVHIARQLGEPLPIARTSTSTRSTTATRPSTAKPGWPVRSRRVTGQPRELEVWFLTGSQHLYGPEVHRPGDRATPPRSSPPSRPRPRSRSG